MTGPVVALIGCGRWGSHILRDLLSLGCDVPVVAASGDAQRNAEAGGAAVIVGLISELPAVAGVVVATPTSTHSSVLDAALGLGVPIFVEKPMTADVVSARRLAAAAPDRLFVMDKWRYHPGVEALTALASSGELGPIEGVRATRLQWYVPHLDVDPIWTLIPHDLVIAREILGSLPAAKAAVADHHRGAVVGLTCVLGAAPWCVVEVGARHPEFVREVRLHCRDGVAVMRDGWSDEIVIWSADALTGDAPEPERRSIAGELPLLRELRMFVNHLDGGPPPASSAAEGLEIVEAIAEVRRLAGLAD
jgi:predicted dehydrogenase